MSVCECLFICLIYALFCLRPTGQRCEQQSRKHSLRIAHTPATHCHALTNTCAPRGGAPGLSKRVAFVVAAVCACGWENERAHEPRETSTPLPLFSDSPSSARGWLVLAVARAERCARLWSVLPTGPNLCLCVHKCNQSGNVQITEIVCFFLHCFGCCCSWSLEPALQSMSIANDRLALADVPFRFPPFAMGIIFTETCSFTHSYLLPVLWVCLYLQYIWAGNSVLFFLQSIDWKIGTVCTIAIPSGSDSRGFWSYLYVQYDDGVVGI